MKKASLFVLMAVFATQLISCRKKNYEYYTQGQSHVTVYENRQPGADALQARVNSIGDNALLKIFGSFGATGKPENIHTISFQPSFKDTVLFVLTDQRTGAQAFFFEVKGNRLPVIFHTEFPGGVKDSVFRLSTYTYEWNTKDAQLVFETSIDLRDSFFYRPSFATIGRLNNDWGTQLQEAASRLGLTASGLAAFTHKGPSLSGTEGAKVRAVWSSAISWAGSAAALASGVETNQPSSTFPSVSQEANPVTALSNPLATLLPSGCAQTTISFLVRPDTVGRLVVDSVQGGVAPYQYAINGIDFENSAALSLSGLEGHKEVLVLVRDARGCISSQLVKLSTGGEDTTRKDAMIGTWWATHWTKDDYYPDSMFQTSGTYQHQSFGIFFDGVNKGSILPASLIQPDSFTYTILAQQTTTNTVQYEILIQNLSGNTREEIIIESGSMRRVLRSSQTEADGTPYDVVFTYYYEKQR